jgi:hypothetical protein
VEKCGGNNVKIDAILGIHLGEYPGNGTATTILYIITAYYLYFAILFMQPWGEPGKDWVLTEANGVIVR